mgnify:CR=1 FL=1
MRAVFINQCHPEMPHVCSLRVSHFAEALVAFGHEVILLVEAYPRDAPCPSPDTVETALATHDWSKPFILPCRPEGFVKARRARTGRGNALERYATIAKSFVIDGGMFADWRVGAEVYFDTLIKSFSPEVVWGTFGNTDTWTMAQKLAQKANCPWVADFKDNWSAFIPDGLKHLMACRFRDSAHMTVLSKSHLDEAHRWFGGAKTVLYSGVEPALALEDPAFRIVISGSIYDENRFAQLVCGLRDWLGVTTMHNIELCYAGNESELVERVTAPMEKRCQRRFLGYISLNELATLQASAAANIYIHNERCLFHHKALELIAAGRPILSYPDETKETRAMAAEAGCALFVCQDRNHISHAMDVIEAGNFPAPDPQAIAQFPWQARAKTLEDVLSQVIGGAG